MKTQSIILILTTLVTFTSYSTTIDNKNSSNHLSQAIELIDAYNGDLSILEESKTILDEIIRSDPNNAIAYRELARYYIKQGHINFQNFRPGSLEAAEECIKKSIKINPNYAEAYVLAGHLYRLMKRPVEAKAALTKADELGTEDPWLQNNWADLLLEENNYTAAIDRYQKVLNSRTTNKNALSVAYEGTINYYQRVGQIDKADTTYQQYISYDPNSAWNYGNYAQFLLCYKDDFTAAIQQANKALTIMNYGMGRTILAAAFYRKWADQIIKNEMIQAKKSFAAASAFNNQGTPSQLVSYICGDVIALKEVSKAEKLFPIH